MSSLMSRSKPIVGYTGPDRGGLGMWLFGKWCIWRAGGKPIRITPARGVPDELDALVLGGGSDITAELYGQKRITPSDIKKARTELSWIQVAISFLISLVRSILASVKAPAVDPERDEMELKLLDHAIKERLPVLGICRGEQLLNVYFGGSLHQDLTTFYTESPAVRSYLPKKRVTLTSGSKLEEITESETMLVNALHRQGVDLLGDTLSVNARDDNEIVQGIEGIEQEFVVGVQWHPEFMPQVSSQQKLFEALVDAAKEVRSFRENYENSELSLQTSQT